MKPEGASIPVGAKVTIEWDESEHQCEELKRVDMQLRKCETCLHDSINSHMCKASVCRPSNRWSNDCMTHQGRIYNLRFHFSCSEWEAKDEQEL